MNEAKYSLIGYVLGEQGETPLLWRGYPRRDPPLVTYQQWREFLLTVKAPRVYFQECKWTGEAFIQCLETDLVIGNISPAEFRGLMFRRSKEGVCFIDQDLPSDVVYGSS